MWRGLISGLRDTDGKFNHEQIDCAYLRRVNCDRVRIRADPKNAFTRMSGRPSGPIKKWLITTSALAGQVIEQADVADQESA